MDRVSRENTVKKCMLQKGLLSKRIQNIQENRAGKIPHPSSIRFLYLFIFNQVIHKRKKFKL